MDATLAHYDGWKGVEHIGAPVPAMVAKVRALRAAGVDVRIFTARVCREGDERTEALKHINDWSREHLGEVLPVTNVKDFSMLTLYDDRCVQVVPNEGREIVDVGVPCPQCSAEAVACVTMGDRRWLKCAGCGTDFFSREQFTLALFESGQKA